MENINNDEMRDDIQMDDDTEAETEEEETENENEEIEEEEPIIEVVPENDKPQEAPQTSRDERRAEARRLKNK